MKRLFVLLSCLLFVACGETESKRRTVGYKGEAKNNPFLAAQRYIAQQGKVAKSEHGLGDYTEETSMLLIPPSSVNTVGRAKRLMEWVGEGGHLVLMLEGGERGGNDFTQNTGQSSLFNSLDEDGGQPGLEHLLAELEVKLVSWGRDSLKAEIADHEPLDDEANQVKTNVDLGGNELSRDEWEALPENERVLLGSSISEISFERGSLKLHHWANYGFEYDEFYEREYGSGENTNESKHRYLSVYYGEGRVTCLSDARLLRNRYIASSDHAAFFNELIELSRPGVIVFSSGEGDGLMSLLWQHYPFAIAALLISLVFWLWRNLPRFGPELDIAHEEMREFSEQLRGIGRFLWRHKRDDVMLGAMRRRLNRGLSLHPEVSNEGVFEQLAERTGIAIDEVIEAMTREKITEPGVMVRVVKNLQLIQQTMNN